MNFQFPRHFSLSSTHKSLIASFPLSKIHTSAWLIASPPSCFSYNIISPNCIPGTSRVDEPFLFWVIFCTLLHTTVSPPPKKKKTTTKPRQTVWMWNMLASGRENFQYWPWEKSWPAFFFFPCPLCFKTMFVGLFLNPWLIHFNVWQNIVISLQLIKIN